MLLFGETHQFLVVLYILTARAYLGNRGLVSRATVMAVNWFHLKQDRYQTHKHPILKKRLQMVKSVMWNTDFTTKSFIFKMPCSLWYMHKCFIYTPKKYGLPHVYFLEDQKGSTKLHGGLSYQIVTKQVYKII